MSSVADQELQYWLAFNQISEIGPVRFNKILNYFPDLPTAWSSQAGDFLQAGLEEKITDKFIAARSKINPEQELKKVQQQRLEIITIKDVNYPGLLREITNPPPLLYCQGQSFTAQDDFTLAVVGTRKITAYGRQVTEDLVRELAHRGLVIVSGLALGIDALAHLTCVQAGGRTIAVLGHGLDTIYPQSNLPLSRRIIDNGGLLLSEFPLGTPSYKSNFPHRNRVIAGLALGTLVIEAAADSGSLITAKLALEQNREVFAVPGSIYAQAAKGPHQLIQQGARLVSQGQDIMETLNLTQISTTVQAKKILPATAEEQQIVDCLERSPLSIDQLISHTGLDAKKINSILVAMELKSLIRNQGGNIYTIAR